MISIIIPIYNMANSLENCVLSIINQNTNDFEIILVDDGSTDDSLYICEKLAEIDERIIVIHQNNQGAGPARNNGILNSHGDYFLFIDSDDKLVEDAFQQLDDILKASDDDLIVFGYEIVSSSGSIKEKKYQSKRILADDVRSDYCPYFNNLYEWGIQGAPWNKLFKASVVKQNLVEFPDLRRHQDEVFISRFVSYAKSICFSDKILYTHYANDAKLIWKKYPANYFDVMSELYTYRQDIVEKWNPANENIKALTYSEYINNCFRASFKLFNDLDYKNYYQRVEFYKTIRKKLILKKVNYPKAYISLTKRIQNSMFVSFISKENYFLLDLLIKLRLAIFKLS